MKRQRLITGALLVVLLAAVVPARAAQGPSQHGWWWRAPESPLPVPLPIGDDPATRPEVPENGLLVAADVSGDEAISALRFELDDDAVPLSLMLQVAEVTGEPSVVLCTVTGVWEPAQGGPWDEKPAYECAENAPPGVLSEDGARLSFSLAGLAPSSSIEVALAPAADAAPFRISFEAPGPDTLETSVPVDEAAVPSGGAGSGGGGATGGGAGTASPPPPSSGAFSPDLPPPPDRSSISEDLGSRQAVDASASTARVGSAPLTNVAPAVQGGVPADDGMRTVGMMGLIVLAALYARYSGQTQRAPRSLVDFGKAKVTVPGEEVST